MTECATPLVLSLFAAGPVAAHGKPKAPKPKITMTQARQTALAAVPGGKIKSGEYENEGQQWIYSFDIATKDGIREVWIDPQTGAVVKNESESRAKEKAEAAADQSAPKS